jgi:PIN domain nuclease of toxin-antitoxin system
MSRLLLDTHAWIWLAAGDPRMAKHERRLNQAALSGDLLLSAVSIYEAAMVGNETDQKLRRGKQAVTMRPTVSAWIHDAKASTRVKIVAIDEEQALCGAMFHAMHGDPFDRLVVAAALSRKARLLTADAQIIAFARQAKVPLLTL